MIYSTPISEIHKRDNTSSGVYNRNVRLVQHSNISKIHNRSNLNKENYKPYQQIQKDNLPKFIVYSW